MPTVQEMIAQANRQNLDQTMARSVADPNKLIVGGTVGTLPDGTPIQNQAITYNRNYTAPTPTPTPARYTPDGSVNTGANKPAPAANVNYGVGANGQSLAPTLLTQDQYTAQNAPKPVDEQSIREEIRKQQQARIDAINGAYNVMVGQQDVVNTGNQGSTRAINARSGLIGSDFGAANDSNQKQAGQNAINAINAERGMKISGVYAEIDQLASQKIAAQKSEALGNANAYKDYLEKAQTRSQTLVKNLGATGETVDNLKNTAPDRLKQLLEGSGMSELELSLAMNAARPPAAKIDWKTDIRGNNVIVYGTDPVTGELQYHTQELPAGAEANDVQVVNGELWSIGADGKSATKIGGPGPKDNLPASAQEYEYAKKNGYTGSYAQYQNEDANRKNVAAGGSSGSAPTSYREWQLAGSPGTYADWLKSGGKQEVGRPLSAQQSQLLSDGANMVSVLNPINELITNRANLFGPVAGRFNAANPYDTTSQTANSQLTAAAQMVGKYMEGGVLRQEDVAKYQKMLPQLSDTPQVAKNKLENVQKLLSDKQQQYIRDYQTAGFDASGFGNEPASTPVVGQNNPPPTPDEMNTLRQSFPGMSDAELLQAGGFNTESQTSLNGDNTGSLSAKYESGGDPGAIGYDKTGSWSYGSMQLAHQNALKFVQQSPYAKEFQGIAFNSTAFRNKWKEVARKDPKGFDQAQRSYIGKTHYEPQINKLASAGVNVENLSPVLRDVIWSTAVQHGPANNIVANAIRSVGENASEADLIKKIYALRWSGGRSFSNSTADVKKSVYNRFFGRDGEMANALASLSNNA